MNKMKKYDYYFESLLDNMIEGVAIHELIFDENNNPIDYRILDINKSYEKILNLKKKNTQGKLASEVYGEAPLLKEYSNVVLNKKSTKFRFYYPKMDKYFSISASHWNDKGFITIFSDNTENVNMEKALKESEFFVRNIVESAGVGIVVYDKNLNYVLWNPQMEELTGIKASEVIGKNSIDTFEHIEKISDILRKVLKGEEIKDVNYEVINNGWRNANYTPLRDTKGDIIGIVAFIKDITERKRHEEEIIKAKELAERSEQSNLTFISNMSHDLRTPINSIIGFSELLKEKGLKRNVELEYLDIIMKNGDQLTTLVNDIIDISKIDSNMLRIQKIEIDLNKFLQYLKNQYSKEIKLLKKKIKINIDIDLNNNVFILADKHRLRQILTNLLNNAIKFTNSGYIKLGYKILDDHKLEIYVKDTGIGISKDDQKTIFDRFVQINAENQKTKGSGLGLSISKSLIQLMGFGDIQLESKLREGSRFSFELPFIFKDDSQMIIDNIEDDNEMDLSGIRILVVEDDVDTNKMLRLFLRSVNATVFGDSGKGVMDIIKNKNIDVVLLDLGLPNISGFEILKEIKKFNNNIKIIIQTAYVISEYKSKSYELGANDFISKPFTKLQLLNSIMKQI